MRLGVEAALVDGRILPGDVEIEGGVVRAVGLGGAGRGVAAPGFVDLQVNGFAGVDLMAADRDGYARVGEALLATGTTAFQPTFVTAPEEALLDALRAMPTDGIGPRVLGAHVEGPFLSPRQTGVHDPRGLSAPDIALLRRLLDAAPVSQVTLAPELRGAFELIDELVARGVTVSAGHTDATAAEAHLAFDRGVRTVTHLFNAMRQSTPRDPSIALAALARPDVVVQVIVDLHHVAADTVMVAWQAASSRFALVTDAAPAAGMGDGEFVLGGRRIEARRRRRARAGGPARGLGADDDRRRAQPARPRGAARGRAAGGLDRARAGGAAARPRAARAGLAGGRRRARRPPRGRPCAGGRG